MSGRAQLALLVVAALLAAYIFGWALPQRRGEADRERQAGLFFPRATDAVEITLRRADQPLRLQRDGEGRWQLVEPVAEPAEDDAVEGWLRQLAGLASLREASAQAPAEAERVDFGLEGAWGRSVSVAVRGRDGAVDSLLVGDEVPGSERRFVQRHAQAPVEVAPPGAGSLAQVDLATFRGRDLGLPGEQEVVELRGPGWAATRRAGDGWRDPATGQRLRRLPLDDLAGRLRRLRASRWVDHDVLPQLLGSYGLAPPALRLVAVGSGGDSVVVELGDRASTELVFGRVPGRAGVLELPEKLLERGQLTRAALRHEGMLDVDFGQLQALVLHGDDGRTITVERQPRGWFVPGADQERSEEAAVALRNVLSALEELPPRATIAPVDAGAADALLGERPVRVELRFPQEDVELTVGWEGDRRELWVLVGEDDALHQVHRQLLLALRALLQLAPAPGG